VEIFTSGKDEGDAIGAKNESADEEAGVRAGVDFAASTVTFNDDMDGFADVGKGFADTEDNFADVAMNDLQSPKPAWHPFPQYGDDEPQNPFLEQQFPNIEFLHVRVLLDCIPQRALVLILRASTPRNGRAVTANSSVERIMNEGELNE
jgi:hypothetical protein